MPLDPMPLDPMPLDIEGAVDSGVDFRAWTGTDPKAAIRKLSPDISPHALIGATVS
jgi:hypothetical protein